MEQRVEITRKPYIGPFPISRNEAVGSDIPSMTEHESSPGRQVPSQHDREVNDIIRGIALRDQAKNRLNRDTAVREGATKVWQRPTGPKFVLNPGKPLTWGESNVDIAGKSETKVAFDKCGGAARRKKKAQQQQRPPGASAAAPAPAPQQQPVGPGKMSSEGVYRLDSDRNVVPAGGSTSTLLNPRPGAAPPVTNVLPPQSAPKQAPPAAAPVTPASGSSAAAPAPAATPAPVPAAAGAGSSNPGGVYRFNSSGDFVPATGPASTLITRPSPKPGVPPVTNVLPTPGAAQPAPQQPPTPVQQQKKKVIANIKRTPIAEQAMPVAVAPPSSNAGAGTPPPSGAGGAQPPPGGGTPPPPGSGGTQPPPGGKKATQPGQKPSQPTGDNAPMTMGQYRQMRAVSSLDPRETYEAAKTHLGVQPSWHQRLASNPWVQQFGMMAGAGALQGLAGRLGLGNNMFTGGLLPMILAQKIPQWLSQHSGTEGYQQQLMQRAEQGQLPQLLGRQAPAAPGASAPGQAAPATGAAPGRARGPTPSPAVLAARAAARRRQAVRAGAAQMRGKRAFDMAGLEPAITHFDFPRIVSVLG